MKRGFMGLAVEIVKEYPGLNSREVAREALDFDSKLSDSKDPEQSLSTTLDRQVRTGNEKRIRRERVGGIYHYFPVSTPSISDSNEEIIAQISLPAEKLKDIDNLVAVVEKYHNRNEAISWLIMEGITANRAYLDKVADTKKQIESLKRDVAT